MDEVTLLSFAFSGLSNLQISCSDRAGTILSHTPTDMTHHEELISGSMEQLAQIFQGSKQSIYLYLDNTHKSCNSNFSKLLGYASPEKWANMDVNFPEVFVPSKSRKTLVTAYPKAMEQQVGSSIDVTWKRKDGK